MLKCGSVKGQPYKLALAANKLVFGLAANKRLFAVNKLAVKPVLAKLGLAVKPALAVVEAEPS